MFEVIGDIWKNQSKADAIVVTTNGFVKKNGEAVMGRGIALEASRLYPDLPKRLGNILKTQGNIVWVHEFDKWNGEADYQEWIITFPVKEVWWDKAKISLIKRSTEQLLSYVDEIGMKKVFMPRPGCGNGGLTWEVVRPIIEPYLDDRFTVFHKD